MMEGQFVFKFIMLLALIIISLRIAFRPHLLNTVLIVAFGEVNVSDEWIFYCTVIKFCMKYIIRGITCVILIIKQLSVSGTVRFSTPIPKPTSGQNPEWDPFTSHCHTPFPVFLIQAVCVCVFLGGGRLT